MKGGYCPKLGQYLKGALLFGSQTSSSPAEILLAILLTAGVQALANVPSFVSFPGQRRRSSRRGQFLEESERLLISLLCRVYLFFIQQQDCHVVIKSRQFHFIFPIAGFFLAKALVNRNSAFVQLCGLRHSLLVSQQVGKVIVGAGQVLRRWRILVSGRGIRVLLR